MNLQKNKFLEESRPKTMTVFFLLILVASLQLIFGQNTPESEIKQIKSISREQFEEPVDADNYDEKYKLIYLTESGAKSSYSMEEKAELQRARKLVFKKFSDDLNKNGEKNYKVIAALPMHLVAIAKLDEARYEYDLFELESSLFFIKAGLWERVKNFSSEGFRIIDHNQLDSVCEFDDPENAAMGESCEYTDRFLVERVKENKKPVEQILINIFPAWGVKPSFELEKQIADKMVEGFYPSLVLSKFEVLLDKAADETEISDEQPDVQIVRSSLKDVKVKINELAKKGYRLAMTQFGIGILYRNRETAQSPVKYIWVNTKKKNFEKDITKLQEQGAVYKMTYPSQRGDENTLIFESKLEGNGERREYKILKIRFDRKLNSEKTKEYVELSESSKKVIKTMNKLVAEGFEVKDLFYSDEVSIILERRRL